MGAAPAAIPVIDVGGLVGAGKQVGAVASALGRACRERGFFYIVGHSVDEALQRRLIDLSREFFALDLSTKLAIRMALGGRAWRGYFPVGGELTSGRPDLKEGLYFGAELPADDPAVRAGTPMHGPNLFPFHPAGLRQTVLTYMEAMTRLGHSLMRGIALSLALPADYFAARYTAEPFILFRIFNYPSAADEKSTWGVGEHTDYGLLTILKQDDASGLHIKVGAEWVEAPPIPNAFVCNLGDMLERMTGGRYRSTPHRVRNVSGRDRLSFPFFFDPNFAAEVRPIDLPAAGPRAQRDQPRWDGASVHDFQGTYGDYLLRKVSKVFPELMATRTNLSSTPEKGSSRE